MIRPQRLLLCRQDNAEFLAAPHSPISSLASSQATPSLSLLLVLADAEGG